MLDDQVALVVQALRDAGMWENTLLFFASDNGGPIYLNGTATQGLLLQWTDICKRNSIGKLPLPRSQTMLSTQLTMMFLCERITGSAGASNYPLRGGKMSNWQGGVRVNAFVGGGALPLAVRGSRSSALATLWDVYPTFATLAGANWTDHEAQAAGLPPVDGIDQWPVWSGRVNATRAEVILASPPIPAGENITTVQGLIQASEPLAVRSPTIAIHS